MEIVRFERPEDYRLWLANQSWNVYLKAKAFYQRYGGDVIPIVLEIRADTIYGNGEGFTHILLHPDQEELIKNILF